MKTSKKIILTLAGVLLALLVSGLMLLNRDLKGLPLAGVQYQGIMIQPFQSLSIKGNWTVKVRQRAQHQVEIEADLEQALGSVLRIEEGQLKLDEPPTTDSTRRIHLRISAPNIASITAMNGTELALDDFQTDSIHIELKNGSSFLGSENILRFATIKTSGDSWIQIRNDPMK